jgi:hypothetical protein
VPPPPLAPLLPPPLALPPSPRTDDSLGAESEAPEVDDDPLLQATTPKHIQTTMRFIASPLLRSIPQ